MRGDADREGASYVCDAGLQLVGPKTLSCLADGTWSAPAPTCEGRRMSGSTTSPRHACQVSESLLPPAVPAAGGCDAPKHVLHGRAQERNLNAGRAVEVQCDKGYELVGEPLVVCIGGVAWSSAFPTCQRERRRLHKRTFKGEPVSSRYSSLQPSAARLLPAGGTTAAGPAPRRTSASDSPSASPAPGVTRSKAAAPSPAGRTRRGASSAPCAKVGEKASQSTTEPTAFLASHPKAPPPPAACFCQV